MNLAAIQRRFHDAVTGRASLASARELVRDDGVDPFDRLSVYTHAYFVRIRDALAAEYPKLGAALGDDDFTQLVSGYLDAHPTRHPSLRDAGRMLPPFLDVRRRDGWRVGEDWLADLAWLERARTEVFDGPDATPLGRDDLAAVDPAAFPTLRLARVPSSLLVALTTNADEVWAALENGAPAPAVIRSPRTVLVWRRDTLVVHRRLAGDEAAALRALGEGATFGEVCAALPERPDTVERAVRFLLGWLDGGLLRGA